jgi:membrane protein YdbS with pleckstrin-like domain
MKTYHTALSPFVAAPIVIIMVLLVPTYIVNKIWFGLAVNIAVFVFVLHMYRTTTYTIRDGVLIIRSGFLYRKEIPVSTINRIRPSRNPISSPAFSLNRLEICHGDGDYVLISPKQKEKFIQDIVQINPHLATVQS